MDFTTAKEALIRQCAVQDSPALRIQNATAKDALDTFEDFLQLTRPVQLQIVRKNEQEDLLSVASSSPVADYLADIAHDAPAIYDLASPQVSYRIMENRIRDLVSLPEQIAALAYPDSGERSRGGFNRALYAHQLSTCILLFSIAATTTPASKSISDDGTAAFSSLQRRCVTYALIRSCVKRGLFASLMAALKNLDDVFWENTEDCREKLTTILDAVKLACFKPRLALARPAADGNIMNHSWHELCRVLLDIAQSVPSARDVIVDTLCGVLIGTVDGDAPFIGDLSLTECTRSEFFSYMMTSTATPRGTLRFIFVDVIPAMVSTSNVPAGDQPCLKFMFKTVFSKWGDKLFAEKGPLDVNTTVMNAVMYSLDKLHQQGESLPSQYLGSLLNGATARLDSARSDKSRLEGMTVAAAFAAYFVTDEETSNSLFSEEQFVSVLKAWSRDEASGAHNTFLTKGVSDNTVPNIAQEKVCRLVVEGQSFPYHPDESFHYFGARRDASVKTIAQKRNAHDSLRIDGTQESVLPAFGTQRVEKDELGERIQLLGTLRDGYNALIGVGRHPNAQMHEVQESLESGLLGMAKCFEQIKALRLIPTGIQGEVDGMIATLMPTLLTVQIHAPEVKQKMLSRTCHQIIVDLISLSPKIALFMLSQVIYSASYSVFQRTNVVKAIGEAARQLAHVRVEAEKGSAESVTGPTQKRLYPPIPHVGAASPVTQSIVVSEGAKTRRWGYVVAGRVVRQVRYENSLAEHASAFMAALLSKTELDHFKFFQDHDVYTPSEVLKTMMIIVQGARTARHVIGSLCQEALTFLLTVIAAHPHDSVRRLAWLVSNEAMRAWCGAVPLIDAEADEIRQASITSTHSHSSLIFSDEWMGSLETLQTVCVRISKKGDTCASVAALVVSGMRDLVCEKSDLDEMQAQCNEKVVEI